MHLYYDTLILQHSYSTYMPATAGRALGGPRPGPRPRRRPARRGDAPPLAPRGTMKRFGHLICPREAVENLRLIWPYRFVARRGDAHPLVPRAFHDDGDGDGNNNDE